MSSSAQRPSQAPVAGFTRPDPTTRVARRASPPTTVRANPVVRSLTVDAGTIGSVGFTDPEHGIGFGYVMNKMLAGLNGDPRSGGLIRAVYEAIGVTPTYV